MLFRLRDPADQPAWREFDRRYGELIVRYCLACGIQWNDAEDIRQMVLHNLSRSMPGFEYDAARGRFRDYLRRVVRHAIARHQSRHTASEIALENDVLDSFAGGQPDNGDAVWEQQWIRRHCQLALKTLRREADPQHVAIFERLLAGDEIGELAESFELKQESIRKIKQRMKERLQGLIARQLRDEDHDA